MNKKLNLTTFIMLGVAIVISITSFIISICSITKTTYYGIFVEGIEVTNKNASNILKDGTVKYSNKDNVLTLNNAKIESVDYGILSNNDLTIKLIGDNTINVSGEDDISGIAALETLSEKNLSIIGNGSLTITTNNTSGELNYGIYCNNIAIENPNINLFVGNSTYSYGYSVGIECNKFTLYSGKLNISTGEAVESVGISSDNNFTMYGEFIDGSIDEETQDVLMNFTSEIDIQAGTAKYYSIGIFCNSNLTLNGGEVKAVGGTSINGDSYGIEVVGNISTNDGYLQGLGGIAKYYSEGVTCHSSIIANEGVLIGDSTEANESYGVVANGNISCYGGHVWASAQNGKTLTSGLYCKGDIEIAIGGSIASISTTTLTDSFGLMCDGKVTIDDGMILAEGDTTAFSEDINLDYPGDYHIYAEDESEISATELATAKYAFIVKNI